LRSARKESSSLLAGTSWDLRAIVSISTSRTARLPTHVEAHGFQALGRRGDADIVAAFGRFAQVRKHARGMVLVERENPVDKLPASGLRGLKPEAATSAQTALFQPASGNSFGPSGRARYARCARST
jgi:hypothetical protein